MGKNRDYQPIWPSPNWLEPEKPDFPKHFGQVSGFATQFGGQCCQSPGIPTKIHRLWDFQQLWNCTSWQLGNLTTFTTIHCFSPPKSTSKNENSQLKMIHKFSCHYPEKKESFPRNLTKKILSISDFPHHRHRLGPNGEAHIFLPFEAVDGPGSSTFLCVWHLCVFSMISCG